MARVATAVARAALRLVNASAAAHNGANVTVGAISELVEVSAAKCAGGERCPIVACALTSTCPRSQCFGRQGIECALAKRINFSPISGGVARSLSYYSGVFDVPRQPYIARLKEEATLFNPATYDTQPGFADGLRASDRGMGSPSPPFPPL